jgi:hypothetical protein
MDQPENTVDGNADFYLQDVVVFKSPSACKIKPYGLLNLRSQNRIHRQLTLSTLSISMT